MNLARRARMDRIESRQIRRPQVLHRIRLHELERVTFLMLNIDTDHIKARPVVAHRGAAGFAEKVE